MVNRYNYIKTAPALTGQTTTVTSFNGYQAHIAIVENGAILSNTRPVAVIRPAISGGSIIVHRLRVAPALGATTTGGVRPTANAHPIGAVPVRWACGSFLFIIISLFGSFVFRRHYSTSSLVSLYNKTRFNQYAKEGLAFLGTLLSNKQKTDHNDTAVSLVSNDDEHLSVVVIAPNPLPAIWAGKTSSARCPAVGAFTLAPGFIIPPPVGVPALLRWFGFMAGFSLAPPRGFIISRHSVSFRKFTITQVYVLATFREFSVLSSQFSISFQFSIIKLFKLFEN